MYKWASAENEIYHSMEAVLVKNQTEDRHGFDKLAKAVDLLNEAAVIFDEAGMHSEADDIATILRSLTEDLT